MQVVCPCVVEAPPMATLTQRDKFRIVFATSSEERSPGLILSMHGAFFAGFPLYVLMHAGLTQGGRSAALACALLGIFGLVGFAEIAIGLGMLMRSERLAIDLRGRVYAGRSGFLFWGRSWAGPLEDFKQIRLSDLPRGRRGRSRRFVVEWLWCEPGLRPFRVLGWGRLQSFRFASNRRGIGSLECLRELQGIARDVGLPLIVSDHYYSAIGVDDLELDVHA